MWALFVVAGAIQTLASNVKQNPVMRTKQAYSFRPRTSIQKVYSNAMTELPPRERERREGPAAGQTAKAERTTRYIERERRVHP